MTAEEYLADQLSKRSMYKSCVDDITEVISEIMEDYAILKVNNPQEVPQVKSADVILAEAYYKQKARITELEKQNSELEALQKSDDKCIKSLEKQIKQYEAIVDKHIISSANYTAEYVDSVIAERDKYREALEKIVNLDCDYSENYVNAVDLIAEQALNHK